MPGASTNYLRTLPDACEALYPFVVAWRESLFVVDRLSLLGDADSAAELAALDEFLNACKELGLDGS